MRVTSTRPPSQTRSFSSARIFLKTRVTATKRAHYNGVRPGDNPGPRLKRAVPGTSFVCMISLEKSAVFPSTGSHFAACLRKPAGESTSEFPRVIGWGRTALCLPRPAQFGPMVRTSPAPPTS
jgi:hypothetical protein